MPFAAISSNRVWFSGATVNTNLDTTWGYLIQQFENEKNNPEKTAELAKIAEDDVYTINKAVVISDSGTVTVDGTTITINQAGSYILTG